MGHPSGTIRNRDCYRSPAPKSKVWGGGKAAIDPFSHSAITTRLLVFTATGSSLTAPPSELACHRLARSRHAILV